MGTGCNVSAVLTSMSFELLPGKVVVAGTMGLLVGGAVGLEQCWGMLGETGSILTMAGVEPRQTDGEMTTGGGRGEDEDESAQSILDTRELNT